MVLVGNLRLRKSTISMFPLGDQLTSCERRVTLPTACGSSRTVRHARADKPGAC